MWESPIYRFKTEVNGEMTEIMLDVTGSAPRFNVPGKQLEGTFGVLLEGLDPAQTKILDFGGAKLRNTLYLLKQGYTVYACEFEDLFKRLKQAHELLKECRTYPNFKKLVFPKEFIEFEDEFDVVLLINVLNIMPVPIERHCVLSLCRDKIKEGGRLLWYTQHGAYSEDTAVAKLYDGLVTGKGRKYKMFYRDYSRKEIHDMLYANGFSYNKDYKFPSKGSNQAYAFIADGPVLIDKTLGLAEQLKNGSGVELETIMRDSWKKKADEKDPLKRPYETSIPLDDKKIEEFNILRTYLSELKDIPSGNENATKYHRLIFNALKSVFENILKKPQIEVSMVERTQRADILFRNEREIGFFKQLAEGYHLICPNIFIECKNLRGDINNPAYSQIQNRLNKIRGQFGIIICRNIINKKQAKIKQDNLKDDDKYVIILTDSDIITLIEYKINRQESKIDEYLEDKFKLLIM